MSVALLRDPMDHLQAMLGFVSLWRSEGDECQGHRRAEGKGAADDNEKHDLARVCPGRLAFIGRVFISRHSERDRDLSDHANACEPSARRKSGNAIQLDSSIQL